MRCVTCFEDANILKIAVHAYAAFAYNNLIYYNGPVSAGMVENHQNYSGTHKGKSFFHFISL